jgi:RimJ/RimL family protein N-acetyltransferase
MRFPIDVVFLDADLTVLEVVGGLRPWRFARACGARAVLELPAGSANSLQRGDRLRLNRSMGIELRPISTQAGEALAQGRPPADVAVAPDHPTEFSHEVGPFVGRDDQIGPFFMHRTKDGVVIGEIGGTIVEPGVVMIGYAVVESEWGRGHATEAVRQVLERLERHPEEAERVVATTPLDRPASGRVLQKAGFAAKGDPVDEEHDGAVMRVQRWERPLRP